jgi:Flp pilus assembly protein TadD
MRRLFVWALLTLSSIYSFGSESGPRACHVQVIMSAGTAIPQNLKLQVFAGEKRLTELTVPYTGSLVLPSLAPGSYRVQTGAEGSNFFTSGPLHVPEAGPCEYGINIAGHADAGNRLVEDDLDVEDLRVPAKARERFEKGFAALQHGQLDEAKKDFQEVVKLDPKLSRAYNVLGVISDQQKDTITARKYFEKALEINPRSKAALMNLAKLCMLEKQYEPGLELLERFRQGTRETADVHAMEAIAYLKLQRYAEAIQEAREVHALPHVNWESVHLTAAIAYEKLHQPEMAAAEYQTYIDETSNTAMRAVAAAKIRELGNVAQQSGSTVPMNSLRSQY